MTPLAALLAEVRARHDDFERRYSPGPDWEPFNQTHRDRGFLLDVLTPRLLALAEGEEGAVEAIRAALRTITPVYSHA